jgi:hypothetical protein
MAEGSSLPRYFAARSSALSPASGTNASMYTSALTFGLPVAASVTTAPPEECPARTIGPVIVFRMLAR